MANIKRTAAEFAAAPPPAPSDAGDDLEVCCVCLDSLSSAPVVALLRAGTPRGRRSCAHFFHDACAARLQPQRCPMCREDFGALSQSFGGPALAAAGATRVIAGTRQLLGAGVGESVPSRAVVELLAATFPVKQTALEVAVSELAVATDLSPRWADQSIQRTGGEEISGMGLVRVLGRCGVPLCLEGVAPVLAQEEPLARYSLWTVLARRARWMVMKGAGALGTAVFAGGCGAAIGISLGSLAAIPRSRLRDRLHIFFWDLMEYGSGGAVIFGGAILLFRMLYYGAMRRDLLLRGVCIGGAFGMAMGAAGALAVVHPEDHGYQRVFVRPRRSCWSATPGRQFCWLACHAI